MMYELIRKGKSRCFVFEKSHINIVEKTIKEIDKEEFSYMPDEWVAFWDYENKVNRPGSHPGLVYNGKFDIDVIKLKIACAKKGVAILVLSTNYEQ